MIPVNMLALFKYDLNIQFRSGYWTVYGILGLVYILILINLPLAIRADVIAYMIFSDTSVIGLIFVGALILLEKQQGVLRSFSVTPLNINTYLFSKALSITVLSALVSSLIWLIPLWSFKGYAMLLAGVILSSIVHTLFGIGFTAGAGSFNQFLARVFIGSLILTSPVFPMILLPKTGWMVIFPANAFFDLLIRILKGAFSVIQLLDLLVMCVWIFIMTLFAQRQFKKFNIFI
jgi:fluoroquinolone transport system permease protein